MSSELIYMEILVRDKDMGVYHVVVKILHLDEP